jgi:hypothetical protein
MMTLVRGKGMATMTRRGEMEEEEEEISRLSE